MAAELSMLSLNQLQNLAQSELQQLNPNSTESDSSWMWNPPRKQAVVQEENDDDSWEVRAFAEDTGNVMGTTWPPRSYTCTFCRREFRSAQALGGHMNVHRRDRARLHQTHTSTTSSNSSSTLMIPTQEFVANGGLCFLYQLPNNTNGVFTPKITNSTINLPSTLLSISPYLPNNMVSPPHPPPPINYSLAQTTSKAESSSIAGKNNGSNCDIVNKNCKKDSTIEELDLELRLGHYPLKERFRVPY